MKKTVKMEMCPLSIKKSNGKKRFKFFLVPKLCLGIHSRTLCVLQRGAKLQSFPNGIWERGMNKWNLETRKSHSKWNLGTRNRKINREGELNGGLQQELIPTLHSLDSVNLSKCVLFP